MKFSQFGIKFAGQSAITQLMDDLNEGVRSGDNLVMLGGGNPDRIPAMNDYFTEQLGQLLHNGELVDALVNYDGPQGKDSFLSTLAALFKERFGWPLTKEHIALTNGSQSSFFYLFNLFAGRFADGSSKKVLLPLAPEYIGYADVGLEEDLFVTLKPRIELLEGREFKYRIDFEQLEVSDDIGLICVSRPTNPSGNVLTDDEIARLSELARVNDIPLLIDNAYGTPFPNIIFEPVTPLWDQNTILCMSLSKLGLPGCRCGIVIAQPALIKAITNLSGIISLSPGSIGPALAQTMVADHRIIELSEHVVMPHYRQKSELARRWLKEAIPDPRFRIHKSEGAIFLWLWFDDLPIDSQTLYLRLKEKGLILVAGHHFFPGMEEPWPHRYQCMRMSYAQPELILRKGIDILAEEINALYAG